MLLCLHAQTDKWDLFEVLAQTHDFTLKEGESECIREGQIALCHHSSINCIFSFFPFFFPDMNNVAADSLEKGPKK